MADTEAEARAYHRRQLLLSIADLLLTTSLLVAWLATGASAALAAALGAALPWPAVVAGVAAVVGASVVVASFPLDVVAGFVLPRQAGLLRQPFRSWLGDKAKGLALGGVLGLLAFELLY